MPNILDDYTKHLTTGKPLVSKALLEDTKTHLADFCACLRTPCSELPADCKESKKGCPPRVQEL